MALTSSYTTGPKQRNGRVKVYEKHVDRSGYAHIHVYPAADGMDRDALLARHAAQIEEALKASEAEMLTRTDDSPAKHATAAEVLAANREAYRFAVGQVAAELARWFLRSIQRGEYTDQEVSTAFGLAGRPWQDAKARMQVSSDALTEVEKAKGE